MHAKFQKQFELIGLHGNEMLDDVRKLTAEEINQIPSAGKWSIAQIVAHVNLSTRGTIAYINKKIQYPETIPQNRFISFSRATILNFILNSKIRLKAPAGLENFPAILTMTEIESGLQKNNSDLRELLDGFPDKLLNRNVFRHPVVGRISMLHALQFIDTHQVHHHRQIRESLK